jgi:methylated-DNA-protein-cysteine methyltransferase-like protein
MLNRPLAASILVLRIARRYSSNGLKCAGSSELVLANRRIEKMNSSHWKLAFEFVKTIPHGRVITYGQLAKSVGLPGGARAAGRAMSACPSERGIPWHRVVGAGGHLLLREPNVLLQRKLLESEGIEVAENRIRDFKTCRWSPAKRARKQAGRRRVSRSDSPASL